MNCCDEYGNCKGGPGCATRKRSCNELALCQGDGRSPFAFAPGAIERHKVGLLGTPAQRRELKRWLLPSLAFTAVVGLCGLAVGVIAGRWL